MAKKLNRTNSQAETISALKQRAKMGELSNAELKKLAGDPRAGVRALASRERRRIEAEVAESARLARMLLEEAKLWDRGVLRVAGVDEVGAGPLAGPVMAAAVILPPGCSIWGVDDSKKLSAEHREELATEIRAKAVAFAIGACSPREIDDINILNASKEAMRRAVAALAPQAQHLLVDARVVPDVGIPQKPIVDGDALSQSIAAASIVAKVERDALMKEYAKRYPGYGFESHMGYGTTQHLQALARLGPCPLHRRSFGPVRNAVQ